LRKAGILAKNLQKSEIDALTDDIPTIDIELQSYEIYNLTTGKHSDKTVNEIKQINKKFRNRVISPTAFWSESTRSSDATYEFECGPQSSEPSESLYVFSFIALFNCSFTEAYYSDYQLSDVETDN
jgi:hypothetical protein